MKRLFILVMVVATAYSAYWVVGSRTVNAGAQDALQQMQADGWTVAYDDLRTRGFPSRFDTTVTDLTLTSPDGVTYTAPFVQAFALSYRPNRVIMAFPPAQTVTVGGSPLTIASDGMRASGAVRANTALSFDEATLVSDMLAISTEVAGIRMRDVLVAARAGEEASYDLYAGLKTLTLPDDLWQQMFPNGALPLSVDAVSVDATAVLSAPLDRSTQAVDVLTLTLKQATLNWGDMSVTATGSLAADPAGFAAGQITVEAREAGKLLQGLVNVGAIDPGPAPTVENMMAALQDDTGKMVVPLTFANGQVSWGFLPLGPAPRLQQVR